VTYLKSSTHIGTAACQVYWLRKFGLGYFPELLRIGHYRIANEKNGIENILNLPTRTTPPHQK